MSKAAVDKFYIIGMLILLGIAVANLVRPDGLVASPYIIFGLVFLLFAVKLWNNQRSGDKQDDSENERDGK